MKHNNLLTLLFFSLTALQMNSALAKTATNENERPIKWSDFQPHWYFGGQFGKHYLSDDLNGTSLDMLTGRAFIGYQISPHFAIESHLALFNKIKIAHITKEASVTTIAKTTGDFSPEIDLLIHSAFYVTDEIVLFAKLGMGIWNEKIDATLDIVKCNELESGPLFHSKEMIAFLVTAVGVNWRLTDSLSLDVTLYYNYDNRFISDYTPSIGFTYHAL